MDREASSLQYKATFCPEPARSSCSVFTLPSSQTKRGPRLEPAGEPQALPLRLWRPSPPPSPSGPGGAPLHSGSHLFPLHRRAAHQAMSKSRSWYHFRDGTHRAPRTHPAARVLIQRREDMAGRQAGSTAQKLCQWRLWVPSPAGWSQVSPFLPRSVTPGSHGWEKLCSQGLWPRGTKGLTQPCWGRKVCLGLVQPCPGHDRVVFPHHSRDSQRVHSKPPPNLRVPPECPLPQALQPHLAPLGCPRSGPPAASPCPRAGNPPPRPRAPPQAPQPHLARTQAPPPRAPTQGHPQPPLAPAQAPPAPGPAPGPAASPCAGPRPGSTPWPAGAGRWEPGSACLQGRPGRPPHWGGSA